MPESSRHAPLVTAVLIAGIVCLGGIAIAAITYGVLMPLHAAGGTLSANDIDAFLAAGYLVRNGQGALVHDPAAILTALRHFIATDRPIIWNYPPHATVITALATIFQTRASMRALIAAVTLAAAVALAWKITRRFPHDRLTRMAAAACLIAGAQLVMTMLTAQPAYLIGMAGIGSVLLAIKNQRLAGAILVALVAMKPHIAMPFYGMLFWKWRWMRPVILLGAALTLALTLVAEAVLGFGATLRFIVAARDAAAGVTGGGHYIQERLLPLVTWLRGLVPPAVITPLHLAIAAGAFTLIIVSSRKTAVPQRILALAGVSTLWLSPYLYDYDLGLAVLCILIYAGASAGRAPTITALTIVATLLGLSGLAVKLLQPVLDLSLLRGWNMAAPVLLTALAVWLRAPKNQCAAAGCADTHTPVNTPPFDIAKK